MAYCGQKNYEKNLKRSDITNTMIVRPTMKDILSEMATTICNGGGFDSEEFTVGVGVVFS